jgi:hypothetical protein
MSGVQPLGYQLQSLSNPKREGISIASDGVVGRGSVTLKLTTAPSNKTGGLNTELDRENSTLVSSSNSEQFGRRLRR